MSESQNLNNNQNKPNNKRRPKKNKTQTEITEEKSNPSNQNFKSNNGKNINENKLTNSNTNNYQNINQQNYKDNNHQNYNNHHQNTKSNQNTQYQKSLNQKDTKNYDNQYGDIQTIKNNVASKFSNQTEFAQSLIVKLLSNSLECVICMNKIKQFQKVYKCKFCQNLNHLQCINELLNSGNCVREGASFSFRCPNCNLHLLEEGRPKQTCYCGNIHNPQLNDFSIPHSCDQPCAFRRDCHHDCPLLCHPGPCPPCNIIVESFCHCKKKKYTTQCAKAKDKASSCGNICGKIMKNCNGYQDELDELSQHFCEQKCHEGPCGECTIQVENNCICGNTQVLVNCCDIKAFQCQEVCGFKQDCNIHSCQNKCCVKDHNKDSTCIQNPSLAMCMCGKTKILSSSRLICTDKLDSCKKTCEKLMTCGHKCNKICHEGDCSCLEQTLVACKCEELKVNINCRDLANQANFICDESCNTLMSCGVHKCVNTCCQLKPFGSRAQNLKAGLSHLCQQSCMNQMPCGHECGDMCHAGPCPECKRIVSNDRLYCACRDNFIDPPIYCGTSVPKCSRKCGKEMECGHTCKLYCHMGPCTNCLEPVELDCSCNRNVVKVACMDKLTKNKCNDTCPEMQKCGHVCMKKCHNHKTDLTPCANKCLKQRTEECNHLCGRQCHMDTTCESVQCKVWSAIFCRCKFKSKFIPCNWKEWRSAHPKLEQDHYLHQIPCDDACKVQERDDNLNSAMQLGLNKVLNPQLDHASEQYKADWITFFINEKLDILKMVDKQLEMLQANKARTFITQSIHQNSIISILWEQCYIQWNINFFSLQQCIQLKRNEKMHKPIIGLSSFLHQQKNGFTWALNEQLLNDSALKRTEVDQSVNDAHASVLINNLTPQDRIEHLKEKLEPYALANRFRTEWVSDFECYLHFKFVDEAELAYNKLKISKGSFNCCKLKILKSPLLPDENLKDFI